MDKFVAAALEVSESVHFRKRIGEQGIEPIVDGSIKVNGDDSKDNHVSVDTTVQEKAITFPIAISLHRKVNRNCKRIAERRVAGSEALYTHAGEIKNSTVFS